nr:argonaute/Dicer protein, PAZ [Tanacetum cinerariifolium]
MDWPYTTKYRALISAQPHRQEIIEDLYSSYVDAKKRVVHTDMIRDHLIAFWRSIRHKPARIIFYRDGVSEGQFNEVLLHEMDKIRKGIIMIDQTQIKVAISFQGRLLILKYVTLMNLISTYVAIPKSRCTRSVSIVPAAYYAHLTAFRARYNMEGVGSESESGGRAIRE